MRTRESCIELASDLKDSFKPEMGVFNSFSFVFCSRFPGDIYSYFVRVVIITIIIIHGTNDDF